MLGVNVQRGTGAGKKKPLRPKPQPWIHLCRRSDALPVSRPMAAHMTRCFDCGTQRPT